MVSTHGLKKRCPMKEPVDGLIQLEISGTGTSRPPLEMVHQIMIWIFQIQAPKPIAGLIRVKQQPR
jgi:hypothetical protein